LTADVALWQEERVDLQADECQAPRDCVAAAVPGALVLSVRCPAWWAPGALPSISSRLQMM